MGTSAAVRSSVLLVALPPKPELTAMGQRIRQAREDLAMSQQELADQATFSASSLQNWEQGKAAPTPAHLRELARLVDRSTRWIRRGEESPHEATVTAPKPTGLRLRELEEAVALLRDELDDAHGRLDALEAKPASPRTADPARPGP